MAGIEDLLRKLSELAAKAPRAEFPDGVEPDELATRLMLPTKPLRAEKIKLHPTKEEAVKRDEDKEYDEALNEAEDASEQLKKWLVD